VSGINEGEVAVKELFVGVDSDFVQFLQVEERRDRKGVDVDIYCGWFFEMGGFIYRERFDNCIEGSCR
jgi:hypothetical protein